MIRVIVSLLLLIGANQATAQDCPAFYRFVDFGLEGSDGEIYRGGVVFRAEGFDGQSLLIADQTACIAAREISTDGHGNPIPLVSHVDYDPSKINIDLAELRLSMVSDSKVAAEANAQMHQAWLTQAQTVRTRGADFLCASPADVAQVSCQFISPYPGNADLVVYCDASECRMPVLAMDERVVASAVWSSRHAFLNDPAVTGSEIADKIQAIQDFLNPLSAAF